MLSIHVYVVTLSVAQAGIYVVKYTVNETVTLKFNLAQAWIAGVPKVIFQYEKISRAKDANSIQYSPAKSNPPSCRNECNLRSHEDFPC